MLAQLIIIGFGIAIIFPTLIYSGVNATYPSPKRTEFFPQYEPQLPQTATAEERKARSDLQQSRQQTYDDALRKFGRTLLIIATVSGLAALVIGSIIQASAVSAGLILGGVFTVGFGYWQYAPLEDWWRFSSLLVSLITLVAIGYRLQHRITASAVTRERSP